MCFFVFTTWRTNRGAGGVGRRGWRSDTPAPPVEAPGGGGSAREGNSPTGPAPFQPSSSASGSPPAGDAAARQTFYVCEWSPLSSSAGQATATRSRRLIPETKARVRGAGSPTRGITRTARRAARRSSRAPGGCWRGDAPRKRTAPGEFRRGQARRRRSPPARPPRRLPLSRIGEGNSRLITARVRGEHDHTPGLRADGASGHRTRSATSAAR